MELWGSSDGYGTSLHVASRSRGRNKKRRWKRLDWSAPDRHDELSIDCVLGGMFLHEGHQSVKEGRKHEAMH